jgi:archaellum component FlaF (FlaF/FlaG flagellin family)
MFKTPVIVISVFVCVSILYVVSCLIFENYYNPMLNLEVLDIEHHWIFVARIPAWSGNAIDYNCMQNGTVEFKCRVVK